MEALVDGRVFDGETIVDGRAVLLEDGRIRALAPEHEVPAGARRVGLEGGLLAPGFIDLQVNGGGGVLLNDQPSPDAIAAIGRAHRRFGTTGFLPTLITCDRATMGRALSAVEDALSMAVPAVLGLHFEGPFLNPARAGVHDLRHMRALTATDLPLLMPPAGGRLLLTLAPERAPANLLERLRAQGVVLSAGHTDAGPEGLRAAFRAGVTGVTHLYNAMAQHGSRAPGTVGAALTDPDCWCSIIVDGHHVHPASVRLAWLAKPRGKLFLVTDAMPPVGAPARPFSLDGRRITVEDGRCAAADGRLAGSCLDMASAIRNAVTLVDIPLTEALRMASTYPAAFLGERARGRIAPGCHADLVLLDEQLRVQATWIGGALEWSSEG